ncbi:MAG: cupin domain-containing protein [Flavobacteriaceae bacterium]|nr:cupin domain-containing protein [Flavobacteriaceae bacterium]
MNTTIKEIIKQLNLQPHPEGGYFKETYRSEGEITIDNLETSYSGKRNYSTCIYFLLTSNSFSAFHRIHQDEVWHFYKGSPILLHLISKKGDYSNITIGADLTSNQVPQFVVPGGFWFAAEVMDTDSFSLVGCTVAPGFHFDDFELLERDELISKYPQHQEIITKLTRS